MKSITLTLVLTFMLSACQQAKNQESPKAIETVSNDKMEWWNDAKFGMFIHWGVYAVPAGVYEGKEIEGIGEWIMLRGKIPVEEYKAYAEEFNPVKYDPRAWVSLAKQAGMKYIVITSKHHDGFALFDSKVSEWDIVDATPYGKDLLKPLADACHQAGIRLGFYYSQAQDWVHPGGAAASGGHWDSLQNGSMDKYLDEVAVPQVEEILSNYGELDILWWDTPVDMTEERAEKFQPVIKEYPNLIMNNRLGGGFDGDTETPEQSIPATGFPGRNWEVCMTMNDTWGYKKNDDNWKSTKELVLKLSEIASKGGNFLLNVGPTPQGEIPQPSIERLNEIGDWMDINKEAIHGTSASPFSYLKWGRATLKNQDLYLHVISWPEDGKLKLPLKNEVVSASVLGEGSNLEINQYDGYSEVMVPTEAPDSLLTIIKVIFKDAPQTYSIPTRGLTPKVSSSDSAAAPSYIFDGDPRTQWRASAEETSATIEFDLGEKIKVGNITMAEPWRIWHEKKQPFVLEYKDGDKWVKATSGESTGAGYSHDFEPITGQYFRFTLSAPKNDRPTLNELVLNRAF